MELEIEMLLRARAALEAHDASCDREAKAILMHPGNFDLIGWDGLLGLPVLPDPSVAPKRARIVCSAGPGGHCDEGEVIWDDDGGAYVSSPGLEML